MSKDGKVIPNTLNINILTGHFFSFTRHAPYCHFFWYETFIFPASPCPFHPPVGMLFFAGCSQAGKKCRA